MRCLIQACLTAAVLFGQAGPYERQKVDAGASKRGRAVYAQYCINCHGATATGTEAGPDLIRSPLVLRDRLGNELGPALKRLTAHNGALTPAQVRDVTHFLKERVEATARNRNPASPPNVLTGDARAGRVYFEGAGGCTKCHSVTGDLAGVGGRYKDAVELQQRFLFPRRTKALLATVTPTAGGAVTGEILQIDDFDISLKDAEGQYRAWTRGPNLRVDVDDPLRAHHELLDRYADLDIHNIVRYLESVK